MDNNNNCHIYWHIVMFRWFRCWRNITINRFNSEHVVYLNLSWTFPRSMFYTIINYMGIMNMYSNQFSKLGFSLYQRFYRLKYCGWYNWYLSFLIMIGLKCITCFTTIGISWWWFGYNNRYYKFNYCINLWCGILVKHSNSTNMSTFLTYYNSFLVFNQSIFLHTCSC